MLDLIVFAAFAYLIYRIIATIFSNIENFISTIFGKTQKLENPSKNASSISVGNDSKVNKPKQVSREKAPGPDKSKLQAEKVLSKASAATEKTQPISKSEIIQPLKSVKVGLTYQQFEKQLKLQALGEKQNQEIENLRQELEQYRAANEQMNEKIQVYEQKRKQWVSIIEQIREQHVINSQQQKPIVLAENMENEQIRAELSKEIDQAHLAEAEKFQRRQQQLKEQMIHQQTILENDYKNRIELLAVKLQQKEEQLSKLSKSAAQSSITEEASAPINNSNDVDLILQLQMKQQEIVHLRNSLEEAHAQVSKLQNASTNKQKSPEKVNPLSKQNEDLLKQNDSLIQDLQSAKRQLAQFKIKFKQERQKSNIFENDKLQENIKLKSNAESLEQLKVQLQNQVSQLNETIFREEQERTQKIETIKEQINKKHELQVDNLNKILEKEQQDNKQANKKLIQMQSELQFVQSQLKTTIQSQKSLSQQLQTMKNSKKSEKNIISAAEVQNHSEYLRLKRKLEELQDELRGLKGKKQEQVKQKQLLSPADKKVNYVRTKIQRQPSPSFQVQTQKRTPTGKTESISSNPKIQSTILGGILDRQKSPIDLRYKTPIQKPIVQSSIYQGGILSESHFGQTNILNQNQREFIISEINHLKKISAKKTRLLYRSLSTNNKPISEYVSNVPNLIVVVELANKKIIAAFTQSAFNKELNNQTEKKYVSANKAAIIDVAQELVIINTTNVETIKYDERALIWGKNEFVVHSEEPLELTCDLNCESAVYPSKYSSEQLLGTGGTSSPINQFEVYRIFLG